MTSDEQQRFQRWESTGRYRDVMVSEYSANPATLSPPPLSFRYLRVGDGEVSLRKMWATGPHAGLLHARRDHVVVWVRGGNGAIVADTGQELLLTPDTPAVLSAGVEYRYTITASCLTLLHVADQLLREHRSIPVGVDRVLLGQDDHAEWPDPLYRVMSAHGPTLADPCADSTARARTNREIVSAMLQMFRPVDEPVRGSATVRAALQFIRMHAAEPVTLADIAAAASCSERSLQDRFQKDLGVTPMGCLRVARMQGVRAVLQSAEPGEISVGAAARAWSIGHLGRFAGSYRDQFGELPAQTLRRRQDLIHT